ncbi:MAG: hypothetical protein SP4CHLAM5_00420 [Chlamydiia bacterium]|nr:hypothetical protein [Chlamydiia bacterium]MCH9617919.1 hypothetical protein [Chlamydiia bacterium]MCH9624135.1 hypothetical protein [Chlamydiia bacterium]
MTAIHYLGVGAGPVGLATAIHTKLKCSLEGKKVSVILLDKRDTYVRTHGVRLEQAVLEQLVLNVDTISRSILSEEKFAMYKALIREYNAMILGLKGNRPIKEIEERLSAFAEQIDSLSTSNRMDDEGFKILQGPEYTVSAEKPLSSFITEYNPTIVVAAGGYRCAATEQVFGAHSVRRAFDKSETCF